MMLLVALFFPLIAGIALMLLNGKKMNVKPIAMMVALVPFAIVLNSTVTGNPIPSVNIDWIPSLGIHLSLAVDGLSLLMLLLTTFLTGVIVGVTKTSQFKNPGLFFGLILAMETGLMGVFTATDGFLFYMFWELALIPIYFITALWGGERRIQITFKFFIYTVVGSLFMLVALIYLYSKAGTFDINAFYNLHLDKGTQSWLFWCIFIAFAIKMPIFPFHTWQPDTYTESPTPATMLLSGIMLKMGIYGVIRWLLPIVPLGVAEWSTTVVTLSIIGIIYASCIAIVQTNVKRMVAYSSIAHVGLIAAGTFSLTNEGLQGSVMQMLAHGINVVALFFVIDIIQKRTNSLTIADLGGIATKAPKLGILSMIVMLGTIALPLTNGFIGEFLLLMGVFKFNAWAAAFAGLTIILGAVYMMNMYKNVMYGEVKTSTTNFEDVDTNEFIILTVLAGLIIVMGVFPKPFMSIAQPALEHILSIAVK